MWSELQAALATGRPIAAHGATPVWAAWLAGELDRTNELVVAVLADDLAALEFEANLRFFTRLVDDPSARVRM
ncbi:MAG: hypothetical protein NT062_25890, partial [Proteobacteria bacterium]|nr:hypothetical protein [Pseudomonadota bacterium]